MIALIRKNLRLLGYGKLLALFAGCMLFSISGRLNGGIAYEQHILSAVSDHYYLTYFVLPLVLLSCFSFVDDDGEPVILRFQSYHFYFLKKWAGVGSIAVILTAVQTGAILLSGIGLPLRKKAPANRLRMPSVLGKYRQSSTTPIPRHNAPTKTNRGESGVRKATGSTTIATIQLTSP